MKLSRNKNKKPGFQHATVILGYVNDLPTKIWSFSKHEFDFHFEKPHLRIPFL